MNRLEDELRTALLRRDPPEGFTDRVMAKVPGRRRPWSSWSHSWMAAAAAMLIAMLGGGAYEYQRVQRIRQEGEQAKAQLVIALEIASEKLQSTKAKVLKVSKDQI
jgi:hypothetical protein